MFAISDDGRRGLPRRPRAEMYFGSPFSDRVREGAIAALTVKLNALSGK